MSVRVEFSLHHHHHCVVIILENSASERDGTWSHLGFGIFVDQVGLHPVISQTNQPTLSTWTRCVRSLWACPHLLSFVFLFVCFFFLTPPISGAGHGSSFVFGLLEPRNEGAEIQVYITCENSKLAANSAGGETLNSARSLLHLDENFLLLLLLL